MKRILLSLAAAVLLGQSQARAVARPDHQHEDLFAERDLILGVRLGPQLSGYTSIQQGNSVINVQSSMRFITGFSAEFIYDLPRFELNLFLSARGGVNNADTSYSLAMPVLAKIPWEVDKGVDFEFGAGFQPESILFGVDPHRSWVYGVLGSIGMMIDYGEIVLGFEVRYNVGLQNIAEEIDGARPRDVQMLLGTFWHF